MDTSRALAGVVLLDPSPISQHEVVESLRLLSVVQREIDAAEPVPAELTEVNTKLWWDKVKAKLPNRYAEWEELTNRLWIYINAYISRERISKRLAGTQRNIASTGGVMSDSNLKLLRGFIHGRIPKTVDELERYLETEIRHARDDRSRTSRKRLGRELAMGEGLPNRASRDPSPSETAAADEYHAIIQKNLAALPAPERRVIELGHQDLTIDEVAKETGFTPNDVKRIRKKFRDQLPPPASA